MPNRAEKRIVEIGERNDEMAEIKKGLQAGEIVGWDEMAELTGTINYELVCLVGKRVPRVYIHHGKNVGVIDNILPVNQTV